MNDERRGGERKWCITLQQAREYGLRTKQVGWKAVEVIIEVKNLPEDESKTVINDLKMAISNEVTSKLGWQCNSRNI